MISTAPLQQPPAGSALARYLAFSIEAEPELVRAVSARELWSFWLLAAAYVILRGPERTPRAEACERVADLMGVDGFTVRRVAGEIERLTPGPADRSPGAVAFWAKFIGATRVLMECDRTMSRQVLADAAALGLFDVRP